MKNYWLSKRIFDFFDKTKNTPLTWFKQVRADDLEENKIIQKDLRNRKNKNKQKVQNFTEFNEKTIKKEAQWTEERTQRENEGKERKKCKTLTHTLC